MWYKALAVIISATIDHGYRTTVLSHCFANFWKQQTAQRHNVKAYLFSNFRRYPISCRSQLFPSIAYITGLTNWKITFCIPLNLWTKTTT